MEETEYLTDETIAASYANERAATAPAEPPFDENESFGEIDAEQLVDESQQIAESQPFFGRWYRLVSATNWEKGRIVQQWRDMMIASGAPSSSYSDEAWSRRVGGVTAPHAGRLRRVFCRFGDQYESYPGLFWSHFLAALDWDDAEMYLEGAVRTGWTVDKMRQTRWEANGALEKEQPQPGEVQATELGEDIIEPAQGGEGKPRRTEDDDPTRIASGPLAEDPDFGEAPRANDFDGPPPKNVVAPVEEQPSLARPFAGLPELPPDFGEALELFKLAIIRHKAAGWIDVSLDVAIRALDGLRLLAQQPGQWQSKT